MKHSKKILGLSLLALCVTPMTLSVNNASENVTNEVETKVVNSNIEYLKTLDNSSLLPKLTHFDIKGQMRAYIFSFDVNGNAIGYTEWHIYQNPVTQQDKDEKEAFFNKDADAHETTYSKVNILNGTYDMATTYADCSRTGFTYFKAVRDSQTLWIKTPDGYGPTPGFVMAYNVKDPGRPGWVHINNSNSANSYGYSISDQPLQPQPPVEPEKPELEQPVEPTPPAQPETPSPEVPEEKPDVKPTVEQPKPAQVVNQEPVNPTPNKSVHTATNVGNVVGLVSTIAIAAIGLVINRKNIK